MATKGNKYRLTLELLERTDGTPGDRAPLQLDVTNHDEILDIVDRLRQKNPFGDEAQAAELAVGLKLFSEVLLRHRAHPLFEELAPAFRSFMQKLKQA